MNLLFTVIFTVCAARLLFLAPQDFLPALLSSASSAASLCFALLSSYCVFCGLSALWEDSGVTAAFAKALKKPVRALFKTNDPQFAECVCMNVSANLLGLGALATPYGVRAANLLNAQSSTLSKRLDGDTVNAEKKKREYSTAVLFTLNAASLQLIPTSVIALRTAVNSVSPSSVVLPILLSSAFFLALSLPTTILVYRPKNSSRRTPKTKRDVAKTFFGSFAKAKTSKKLRGAEK